MYFADDSCAVIEKRLNADLNEISNYFKANDLVINLSKGKTESMLFGTAKRIKDHELKLTMNNTPINTTTTYKYLGVQLDTTLSMASNFELQLKKASSRLRLLASLRQYLTPKAALEAYRAMILPIVTYCGITNI